MAAGSGMACFHIDLPVMRLHMADLWFLREIERFPAVGDATGAGGSDAAGPGL